ncbi:DMT family transporter [Pseudoflavonifractor hominis]|uniref:Multidrug resistance efflux transporter family protein n=1 Tax=Pseudoflavonifractor hominis TaxID=2763059 RepID=A0ABR7HTQ8_9FIRM|nr:multidrug resistance efflux transporter family protein [Pseudoflavonifractor hominis]MBC5730903.1 multidrug resistance efflux transporter family protein [Pseudoflavonifractor hominis]
MKRILGLGILSSFFFAFTFILNRSMNLSGGYWIWSASLRYLFSLPFLWGMVGARHKLGPVLESIRRSPGPWLLWSTVGFGLFYAPLTWASDFGESWLTVSLWQLTIVAGVFLNPLWGKKIPRRSLGAVAVILLGVVLIQSERLLSGEAGGGVLTCLGLISVAAVAYPLGNRKMMDLCGEELDTPQRVLGMTICSLPFFLALSAVAVVQGRLPSGSQCFQALLVAIFSAVIATILFFQATNLGRGDPKLLSLAEGTIAGEIIFTLIGGVVLLGDAMPTPVQFLGIGVIIAGLLLNCRAAAK